MRTLVLDQGYQPLNIVGLRKAIGYVLKGKVEVLEEYDEEITTMTISFRIPAVVRMLHAITGRRQRVKFSRVNVMARDAWRCQYCNVRKAINEMTFDHVLPQGQGGATSWENIVTACRPCNLTKGNRTPEQAGMVLKRAPRRPASAPEIMFRLQIGGSIPDAWCSFVYWNAELEQG
jgi:5-methylcytosine-specific restriction endonuclease McrA